MINFALIFWPILTFILARAVPWQNALIASLIGGYLLLPERGGLDLPLLPPFEKDTIPCLVLFFIALILKPNDVSTSTTIAALKSWAPKSAIGIILMSFVVFGALLTAVTNSDPLRFAASSVSIPGLTLYDGFSMIVTSVGMILPILLGRKYLSDTKGHQLLLLGLVVWALFYSLLALVEARLSPQMNHWVYGFFPHSWQQHVRGGSGFRPLVFLKHGLLLAIFFAMAAMAAFGMSRINTQHRLRWLFAGAWLMMTIILSNSLGAALIAIALLPVVLLFSLQLQLLAAGLIAALVLFYPLIRGAGLVPANQIVQVVSQYNTGRALSLQFRLSHEDKLLERANERPLFGWGQRGRNRVFDETGRNTSVVDGAWIVTIGQRGWVGYLGEFGLLSVPLLLFALRRRRYNVGQATAALCLVLAANMIDMIPNSGRSPITWLIVGALLGRLERGTTTSSAQARTSTIEESQDGLNLTPSPLSPYTRQSAVHRRRPTLRKS